MSTRKHVHEEAFPVTIDELFRLLITPSAIRHWWSAARVIVMPERGGVWAAAWGDEEDRPDYITVSTVSSIEPPHRLVLSDYRYWAKSGPMPFEADFVTEFLVRPEAQGAILRVTQDGFPAGQEGDAFLAACETGWRQTFTGIREFLQSKRG